MDIEETRKEAEEENLKDSITLTIFFHEAERITWVLDGCGYGTTLASKTALNA